MAAPDVVGRGERPSAQRSSGGVACCQPTLHSESPGSAACLYLQTGGVGPGVRLGAHSLGRKEEDDEDEVIPLADPEVEDGEEEEDDQEDDKETRDR